MADQSDPFFQTFAERVGPKLAESFTDEQLDAIKRAFGARHPSRHMIDFRLSLPVFMTRFYMVLLIGRERRQAPRLRRVLSRVGRVVFSGALVVLAAIALILILYPIKTAAGIDIFTNGGLHDWIINPLMDHLHRLFGASGAQHLG